MTGRAKKAVTALSWAAVALCAGVIFYLSHQQASESQELSSSLRDGLLSRLFDALGMSEDALRTVAHWLEYCGLGLLAYNAFRQSGAKRPLPSAILCCALYSVSDEIHQHFVPGRACQAIDVAVDCFGAAVGAAACLLIYAAVGTITRKRKKNGESEEKRL